VAGAKDDDGRSVHWDSLGDGEERVERRKVRS